MDQSCVGVAPSSNYNPSVNLAPSLLEGKVSPHSPYQITPINSPIYVPNTNNIEVPISDHTILYNLDSLNITNEPLQDFAVNSRDFSDYEGLEDKQLSESLSMNLSLNGDENQHSRCQQNTTDSLTTLANTAFTTFEG